MGDAARGSGFVDEVERGLGGPAEAAEPAGGDQLAGAAGPAWLPSTAAGCWESAVVVGPGEGRPRVGLGHDDGRGAVAAADVGHPRARLELGLDAIQGRDPGRDQVGPVAGGEEHLAAVEDLGVRLVPADPGAGAEGFGDAWLGLEAGQGELERAGQVHGAARAASHSFRYRSAVPVRSASSDGRSGPAPAMARYRPRRWPRTTMPACTVAARSCTNWPRKALSLSSSTATPPPCRLGRPDRLR